MSRKLSLLIASLTFISTPILAADTDSLTGFPFAQLIAESSEQTVVAYDTDSIKDFPFAQLIAESNEPQSSTQQAVAYDTESVDLPFKRLISESITPMEILNSSKSIANSATDF